MKFLAVYVLASIALVAGTSEEGSLRGIDLNVERELANACANSDTEWNTFAGEKCYSRCACEACEERGGGVCCVASCNPNCDPNNPPCADSIHKFCYDKKLCKTCKKKGLCCVEVCDFHHCNKKLPPCDGPCFENIDDCQEDVQCLLGCGGTDCANLATQSCHECCSAKHTAPGSSCKDYRQSCKNECNQVYNSLGCSF